MELAKTGYVVLGMLARGMRTGYDIKRLVDVSTRFFWAASYGQIYPELSKLEEAGLVQGEREPPGGRRRKEYELTPAGREALHEWLTSEGPLHLELRHEGLLKLFFADELSPDERRELLGRVRAEHESTLGLFRSLEPDVRSACAAKGEEQPLAVLQFGIAYHELFAGWCRERERELEASRA